VNDFEVIYAVVAEDCPDVLTPDVRRAFLIARIECRMSERDQSVYCLNNAFLLAAWAWDAQRGRAIRCI
jgi:hypothetical protein